MSHEMSHKMSHKMSHETSNLNFHTLKGQLDAYCDGVRTGNGEKIYEDWVVFCDDNKNGELDEDEQKVQFETVYDYVYTGTESKNFKGIDKNHSEFQTFSLQNSSSSDKHPNPEIT